MGAPGAVLAPPQDITEILLKAEDLEDLVTPPRSLEEEAAPAGAPIDIAQRRVLWHRQVRDAVLGLSMAIPEGVDEYDVRKLLEFIVTLGKLVEADQEARDRDGQIELTTMQAADIVRRIQRRIVRQHLDDPQAALELIFGLLSKVNLSEIARLLGTSTKATTAWKKGSPVRQTVKRQRIVLVAQVLTYLRDSMTPHGLVMWFDAERDQLGGRTPLEVLDEEDPGGYELLTSLASGSRGQLGS